MNLPNIPEAVDGLYTIDFGKHYIFTYSTKTDIAVLSRNKLEIQSRVVRLDIPSPEFQKLLRRVVLRIRLENRKLERASAIGRIGNRWEIIGNGNFALCRNFARNSKHKYAETKTIYSINLPKYGL